MGTISMLYTIIMGLATLIMAIGGKTSHTLNQCSWALWPWKSPLDTTQILSKGTLASEGLFGSISMYFTIKMDLEALTIENGGK